MTPFDEILEKAKTDPIIILEAWKIRKKVDEELLRAFIGNRFINN